MCVKILKDFKVMQMLTLDWQEPVDGHDDECPFVEDRITLKVRLKDGTSKILAINSFELVLHKSFHKGTALVGWQVGQPYALLKQYLGDLLEGDVETIFFEAVNILVWWRTLHCEKGADFPFYP